MSDEHISCEEVIEQLFAFLDCELDDELRDRVDQHMAHCRDCFTRAEFERRLRARIRESSEAKAPARLHRRIQRVMNEF